MVSFFPALLPDTDANDAMAVAPWGVVAILLLGVAIRVFACAHSHIINPDGVYYIHQARAVYFGEWDTLTSCHLGFLSNYPLFIAGAYALFHHWVFSAAVVSVLFGSGTLIPLYLLCRRFFDRNISALTLLVFALLPVFVARSADVVRGPVCWFFLALGLYFFVKSEENAYGLGLLFSSLFFLMASWARIESVLFILVSAVYLVAAPSPRRFWKLIWFALPLLGVLFFVLGGVIYFSKPLDQILRLQEVMTKLSAPIMAYETIREGLAQWMNQQPVDEVMPHFLHKTRNMVWLVGLGTLFKYMIRACFYVFFIPFILGAGGVWQGVKEDRRILYLSISVLSAFFLLYLHIMQTWMMFDRFWAVFLVPAFVFLGFGLQKTVSWLLFTCRLKKWTALSLVCFLILAITLPKNLQPQEADKGIYKEMGEMIAQREGNDEIIPIAKSRHTPNWTPFYANLHYKGAPCPLGSPDLASLTEKGYDTFIKTLKQNDFRYLLWEEEFWPRNAFDFSTEKNEEDFIKLREWRHPDAGRIILYRIAS
ncbi:MAG: ArnT family glycosyltransferase [Desulfobacteraceae bacterium]